MAGNAPQGRHQPPARGVLAGIKADAERAKDLNRPYDPSKVGNAWSHNFLNQKPWHPLNFRNQARVYEAEQEAIRQAKANQQAKADCNAGYKGAVSAGAQAEFDAEQDYMKTLSYLSQEEQDRYKARQSVSFLYTKPPGFSELAEKIKDAPEEANREVPSGDGREAARVEGVSEGAGRGRGRREGAPRNHVANMLGAIAALHQHEKWEVKHVSAMGRRTPPRGGLDPDAENQQLLVASEDEEEEEEARLGRVPTSGTSKRERKRQKLKEAQEVLRAAGLLEAAQGLLSGSGSKSRRVKPGREKKAHKMKADKPRKESKAKKEKKERRREGSEMDLSEGVT